MKLIGTKQDVIKLWQERLDNLYKELDRIPPIKKEPPLRARIETLQKCITELKMLEESEELTSSL